MRQMSRLRSMVGSRPMGGRLGDVASQKSQETRVWAWEPRARGKNKALYTLPGLAQFQARTKVCALLLSRLRARVATGGRAGRCTIDSKERLTIGPLANGSAASKIAVGRRTAWGLENGVGCRRVGSPAWGVGRRQLTLCAGRESHTFRWKRSSSRGVDGGSGSRVAATCKGRARWSSRRDGR